MFKNKLSYKTAILILIVVFLIIGSTFGSLSKEKEKVILHFWELSGSRNAYQNFVIEKFKQLYPDIDVKLAIYDSESFKTAIVSAIRTETPPDIFQLWVENPYQEQFVEAGYLYPLTEAYRKFGWENDLDKTMVDMVTYKGEIWGIPTVRYTFQWIYNKNLFQKYGLDIPDTWSDFLHVCSVLKNNGVIPIAEGNLEQWRSAHWTAIPIEKVIGPEKYDRLLNQSWRPNARDIIKWTDPGVVEGMKKIEGLLKNGYFNEGINSVDNAGAISLILRGKAAMLLGGSFEVPTFRENVPADFDLDIFSYPTVKEGIPGFVPGFIGGCLRIAAKSKYKEEALKFLEFYFNVNQMKHFLELTNQVPATISAKQVMEYSAEDKVLQKLVNFANEPYAIAAESYSAEITSEIYTSFQGFIGGSLTAEQYLEKLEKVAEELRTKK